MLHPSQTPTSRTNSSHSSKPPGTQQPVGRQNNQLFELDHAIGFSAHSGATWYHPNDKDFVCSSGACVVACEFDDAHNQVFYRGHDENISCMALSNDGRLVASGQYGENSDVLVWNFSSQKLLYRLSEHDHGVASIAFSKDGLLLASVGVVQDDKLFIWDMQTGNIVAMSNASARRTPVYCIAGGGMVKDIKGRDTRNYQFVTAGLQNLTLWSLDPYNGTITPTELAKNRDFCCVAFSSDYKMLYAGSLSGDFVAVDMKSKASRYVQACSGGIRSLATPSQSNNNIALYVGGGDGTFTSYNFSLNDIDQVRLEGEVNSISLSPDAQEALCGTSSGQIYRITTSSKWQPVLMTENPTGSVLQVDFDSEVPDRFATLSMDCTVRIWDRSTYRVISRATVTKAGRPHALSYNADVFVTGWEDGTIRCHQSETGQPLWTIPQAHVGGTTSLALSHNMRFIVSGGQQGEVRMWEFRSKEMVCNLKEHTMAVTKIVLFNDDSLAVSCGKDRSIICWDLRNERRLTNHTQRMGGVNAIVLTPNQAQVLSVGQEKRITYWDFRKPEPVFMVNKAHQDEATCIAVSTTGKIFVTGGTDTLIKVWDLESSRLIMDLVGHSGPVRSVKFSPDGKTLVSSGDDGSVMIWATHFS